VSGERHRTVVDGIGIAWTRITATSDPSDSPVVFLHGLGASMDAFSEVALHPALSSHERILVDLPGYGGSDRPDGWSYAIEAQADLLWTLLREIAFHPVALVGHSMGGSIAIALASRHPGMVARLVVAEPNLDPGGGVYSRHISRQSERVFVDRGYRALVYQARRQAERGAVGAVGYAASLERASPLALHRSAVSLVAERAPTFREQLATLAIPRTLLWGELTTPLDQPLADPAIDRVTIPDAGHDLMAENPAGFTSAVQRALDTQAGDGAL
jgi:pimeloyl-ACP methyl ester carboxylesterase